MTLTELFDAIEVADKILLGAYLCDELCCFVISKQQILGQLPKTAPGVSYAASLEGGILYING